MCNSFTRVSYVMKILFIFFSFISSHFLYVIWFCKIWHFFQGLKMVAADKLNNDDSPTSVLEDEVFFYYFCIGVFIFYFPTFLYFFVLIYLYLFPHFGENSIHEQRKFRPLLSTWIWFFHSLPEYFFSRNFVDGLTFLL